ncbi:MAG TPA: hypothetical protein VIF57_23625 [Polyangia bacterium]|jgi:hypothetical protein
MAPSPRLDRRLAALAASFGATMTRYADDLACLATNFNTKALSSQIYDR